MPTPAFPDPLPSGASFYAYPTTVEDGYDAIQVGFENGAIGTARRRTHPVRRYNLVGEHLPEVDKDCALGFLRDRGGGAEAFTIVDRTSYVPPPYDAPTLDETGAGGLGGRTYYVGFSYSDGTNETLVSYQEGSKAVTAGKYLTVAVPTFPKGVTEAKLYIGTVSGTLYYSGKIATSNTTWTEDDTTTTVDVQSLSGQKVLSVAATAGFQVGGVVLINGGGGTAEVGVIASIQAAVSLTMEDDMTYTHEIAESVVTVVGNSGADAVPTANALEETVKVVLAGNPTRERLSTTVWNIRIPVVESLV